MKQRLYRGIWARLGPYAYTVLCWLISKQSDEQYQYVDGVIVTTAEYDTERAIGHEESEAKAGVHAIVQVPFFITALWSGIAAGAGAPFRALLLFVPACLFGILWMSVPMGLERPTIEVRA